MSTNFLGLDLPTVSVTLGPLWAAEVNAAFEVIDLHDHSSGKGVSIPSSALNINAAVDFDSNKPFNLLSTQYSSNATTLTGSDNANSISVTLGDLYYTNSTGTSVQITSGGSVITTPGALQTVEIQAVSSNITISPSSSFVYMTVDTSAARQITLPLANSVASGRIYIVKDVDGLSNTNNITMATQGSDTINGGSSVLDSDYGSWWFVGDGVSAWYLS